nr:Protein T16G1.9 [Haemonchus contortus]
MTALFEQAATLGRVEHELTKFAYGIWRPPLGNSTMSEEGDAQISGFGLNKKMPISVFVEMILNPENLNLERLTPIIFKKARIELRRSLMALDAARKTLPYNFELALVLAEIKLVTELMVLTSSLLEIRTQFQHVWLSRSIPSTLPNALKMFDNLFRALLPPDLQEVGKQLL